MTRAFILFFVLFSFNSFSSQNSTIEVMLFLSEQCPICKYYTLDLKEMHTKYASDSVVFTGVFPSKASSKQSITDFKEKYTIPFDLVYDSTQTIARKFQATITPEVVVYDHEKKEVLYQGRIDDSYFRVGKRRPKARNKELATLLHQFTNNQIISITSHPAVGCLITYQTIE